MPKFDGINVTPMVDVILVLLIVYMVAIPLVASHGVFDLPKVHHSRVMPNANREDAIVVSVSRDGRIYLGSGQVEPSLLKAKVKDLLASQAGEIVYLRGDARAATRMWLTRSTCFAPEAPLILDCSPSKRLQ